MVRLRFTKLLLSASIIAVIYGDDSDVDFRKWMRLHEKSYSSNDEYQLRRSIWRTNVQNTVAPHNKAYMAGWTSFKMTSSSPFADMTDKEFESTYLMKPRHCALASLLSTKKLKPKSSSFEKRVDWRTKGVMTPVKNQKSCGSCWSFATTGTLEAHTCIAEKRDCSNWKGLSEQQLVDCSGNFENDGCQGGWPSAALEYIKYNGGIDLETSYKYQGKDRNCSSQNFQRSSAKVAEVFNITYQDEEDLEYVIATIGPVSIAYQVSPNFRFYEHGIYDSYNATSNKTECHSSERYLNHAVVAIGMDTTDDNIPFYIIRNSWGTSWGMEGHFWMKRGVNLCGISDCASFPVVPSATKAKAMLRFKNNDDFIEG